MNVRSGRTWIRFRVFIVFAAQIVVGLLGNAAVADIDFQRDIRPILADKCYKCHGFDPQVRQAGVRLDTREGLTTAGDSGIPPVVPAHVDSGSLLARVTHSDPSERMPPADAGDPLTERQVDLLRQWIAEGVPWSGHWSFQPPNANRLPMVRKVDWPQQPIDTYLLAHMERQNVEPSPAPDRNTLVRRLYLDLLGLPPSPADVDRAVGDQRPDWYERLVDRLLANPHYGERMARLWLDAARYADSSGYANDKTRSIWPYRDWVVAALNYDLPCDQCTSEQIAGDLLPQAKDDQIVATGFHRNTPHQYEGGSDPEQYRVDRVKNRVDTTGAVWLGLTLGCAQCHTHKFDPISQTEYYQLYAFFNNDDEPSSWVVNKRGRDRIQSLETKKQQLEAQLPAAQGGERERVEQELSVVKADLQSAGERNATTLVMQLRDELRTTQVHQRGNFLSLGETVSPGTPKALHPLPAVEGRDINRLDLARWLADKENPLTARVMVNRMWQHFFGTGLVETENDFGTQGSSPSHPELLDWLARRFQQEKWSVKSMHRIIVTSAAYRQSSRYRDDLVSSDPRNRLFARQSRHRVEAEIVRDLALGSSGLFAADLGGPSVFPPVPENVMGTSSARHSWPTSQGRDRYRRGVYTTIYRAEIVPLLSTFDGPDRDNACTRRSRSNTPLQSLTMANDPAMVELAQGLGARILAEGPSEAVGRTQFAFMLCLARPADTGEVDVLTRHYQLQLDVYRESEPRAREAMGSFFPQHVPPAEAAACVAMARVMLNLDNFVTRE